MKTRLVSLVAGTAPEWHPMGWPRERLVTLSTVAERGPGDSPSLLRGALTWLIWSRWSRRHVSPMTQPIHKRLLRCRQVHPHKQHSQEYYQQEPNLYVTQCPPTGNLPTVAYLHNVLLHSNKNARPASTVSMDKSQRHHPEQQKTNTNEQRLRHSVDIMVKARRNQTLFIKDA